MDQHCCPKCGYSPETKIKGLSFVAATRTVTMNGRSCHVGQQMLDVIEELMDAYPRAVSLGQLLDAVYSHEQDESVDSLRVQITKLRRTFEKAKMAITVGKATPWGEGYRLVVLEEQPA